MTDDVAAAAASREEKTFDEYEKVCSNIKESIHTKEEEVNEFTKQSQKRKYKLVTDGAAVRDTAINCHARRS